MPVAVDEREDGLVGREDLDDGRRGAAECLCRDGRLPLGGAENVEKGGNALREAVDASRACPNDVGSAKSGSSCRAGASPRARAQRAHGRRAPRRTHACAAVSRGRRRLRGAHVGALGRRARRRTRRVWAPGVAALGRIALSCGGTTYGSSSPSAPSDTSVRNSSASFIRSRLSAMSLFAAASAPARARAGGARRPAPGGERRPGVASASATCATARQRMRRHEGERVARRQAWRAHLEGLGAHVGGQVRETHACLGLVAMLTARPGTPKGVDLALGHQRLVRLEHVLTVARAIPPLPPRCRPRHRPAPAPGAPCRGRGRQRAAAALAATVVPAVAVAEAASVAPRLAHMAAACAHMPPSPPSTGASRARALARRAAPACPRARGADGRG